MVSIVILHKLANVHFKVLKFPIKLYQQVVYLLVICHLCKQWTLKSKYPFLLIIYKYISYFTI